MCVCLYAFAGMSVLARTYVCPFITWLFSQIRTTTAKPAEWWAEISADNILKYFSDISQKTGFDISCKLSPKESLLEMSKPSFWGKIKKNHQFVVCWTSLEGGNGYFCLYYLHVHSLQNHPITKTSLFKTYWKFYHQKMKKNSDKNSDIFQISAQNIDCGYSLEPPRRGGSNEYT